jgi:hypothetical protein
LINKEYCVLTIMDSQPNGNGVPYSKTGDKEQDEVWLLTVSLHALKEAKRLERC